MKKKKIIIVPFVLVSFLYSIFYIPYSASAFESSSTSFEIHAGDVESTVGTSTSATFRLHNAGGQTATASSTSATKQVLSGVLYWLYSFFVSSYDQIHYRWRADDGSEVTATWPVNEDIQYVSFPKNTFKRLRLEVANNGGWTRGAAPVFTLEVAPMVTTCAAGTYAAVPTTYGAGAWVIATSTNITDGAFTTNVGTPPTSGLTDVGNTFVQGQIKTLGNTTAQITVPAGNFTEIEFALVASNNAVNGAIYCFRLNDNQSPTRMVYTESKYGKAVIASGLPSTGTLDSAVFDTFDGGASALKGPAYNSIMWRGATEGTGKVRFQFATSDCTNGLDYASGCTTGAGWTFYGSSDNGVTCNSLSYYDTLTSGFGGGPNKPVELSCSPTYHNNQRYFRYRIQLCSSDCSSSGVTSPVVDDVVVNWAP